MVAAAILNFKKGQYIRIRWI